MNVQDQQDNMEGSKSITTEVTYASIMERMKDHVYYLGESIKSNPQLVEVGAKLQASADEDPVLKDFIKDATSIVCNIVSRALGITTYADGGDGANITFTTKAPANTPDLSAQLKDYITNYMATCVMESWLKIIKADEAVRFAEMRNRLENEIVLLSTQRSKPTRT